MISEINAVALGGVDLGYCIHGAGPGKPPLVFVHGYSLRATAGPYDELLAQLATRHVVYALDLRGHGASAAALAGWSVNALADDVVAFARALGLARPVLVGHSFGSFISLLAEIRHPGSFSALCLLTPGPADPRRDPVQGLQFLIEHGRNRDMLGVGFGRMFVRPPGPLLDSVLDAMTLVDAEMHRMHHDQHADVSIDDRLKDVIAPVLLVRGERDTVISPARQHDIARQLQQCKEVVFPDEGHMLPNESASLASREILQFLDHDLAALAAVATD
jgi:pimeloyl-ACP methyl ester carboxylesterase